MDFGKIWDFIADKNIEPKDILSIVEEVKRMDVSDEENLRKLIRKISILANKDIPYEKETMLVKKIQKDGIDLSLLGMI
ncbi:MAG: stage VI sporulation protein F [bacterium]